MASNGLVANPSKTEFMIINNKSSDTPRKIRVGNSEVEEVRSAKLLGMTMDSDQKWTNHFWGKKGLLNALNQRLFAIRRIANHIPKEKLSQVANSIWMSKIRYGLHFTNKVRFREEYKCFKCIKETN